MTRRNHTRPSRPRSEPRALLVKQSPGQDRYVAWSEILGAPLWTGTRAGAARYGYAPERIARADRTGSSSLPGFYRWDSSGMFVPGAGFLPRRHLRAFAVLHLTGYTSTARDLLEPFED